MTHGSEVTLPGLSTRYCGRRTLFFEEVASTQDILKAELGRKTEKGLTVLAGRQNAGRGRHQRSWVSIPGEHLYTSILLKPSLPLSRLPIINIAAGIAVCEALESHRLKDVGVKWPNDVYVRERKIAGILSELVYAEGEKLPLVVLGIGVNLHGKVDDLPKEISQTAITFEMMAPPPDPFSLLSSILNSLETWVTEVETDSSHSVQEEFIRRWIYRDRKILIQFGDQELKGTANEIDVDGALLFIDSSGLKQRVFSGDSRLSPD